jgi:hypothetical protein
LGRCSHIIAVSIGENHEAEKADDDASNLLLGVHQSFFNGFSPFLDDDRFPEGTVCQGILAGEMNE